MSSFEFYMLPKIHKPGVTGRPIISGCNSPTANLSRYIDHYLKPIVRNISSYIQDTTHFLRILKEYDGKVPSEALLVTFDVKSLYTNIPTDLGIEYTLQALLGFYRDNIPLKIQYIEQILIFILKKNYFEFNENFYLQLMGTAMGSSFAPNYANIFMDRVEQQILTTAPENNKPLIWKRYIDDIYVIWTKGEEALCAFHDHMNSLYDTIQFEMSSSKEKIAFLDTMTILDTKGSITTTLYKKPTDVCSLLHAE